MDTDQRYLLGCCADRKYGKGCDDSTCMWLPTGKTCGDCRNFSHCRAFMGRKPDDDNCDFFPRRFSPKGTP